MNSDDESTIVEIIESLYTRGTHQVELSDLQ